jgi:Fur family transcriptional regulator, ferric uptake regulator
MITTMMSKADQTKAWLRRQGFRVTAMRRTVIELLEETSLPLTLPEIHRRLPKGNCDFSTLFRFVETLEAKGLLERIPWIDGSMRYHLHDKHHHRHYLICRQCKRVDVVAGCTLGRSQDQVGLKCGYTNIEHVLLYSGICPLCQKKGEAASLDNAQAIRSSASPIKGSSRHLHPKHKGVLHG